MGAVREEFATSKNAIVHVVTNPALRRLFSAYTASLVGNGIFTLTVAVVIFRAGGASAIGILAVARYVAIAALAPFTSSILDVHDRRRTMAVAEAARVVCTALAGVATARKNPARAGPANTPMLSTRLVTTFAAANSSLVRDNSGRTAICAG